MSKIDPQILAHLEWIGFVQPTGLVVSAPALVRAGAILDRRDAEGQVLLRGCLQERIFAGEREPAPWLLDFREFARQVLGWNFSPKGYAGTPENPIPPELEFTLTDYGETLRPDFAVRELDPQNGRPEWQLVVRILDPGQDFDKVVSGSGKLEASPHGRMERLLRQTGVPAGLLFNGRALRLMSAPRGESSGWMDFHVADMTQTAGRPICTALRLLLGQTRLLALPRSQRLTALLDDSRKFQNEVSERLAEQVLHALYELLRGFQAAHDASGGALLHEILAEHPDEVYRALLTVILRLVFLLYAEERDILPEDEIFLRYYSLAGLYERLREDAALFPDTMDQRYGAWAQLLVLFRLIHDGGETGVLRLPKRHGVLFDPDRFKFLEGRPSGGARQITERIEPPLVPDGTIYRALEKLLILDGERISYRALDVEQIGSVYETMMGFRLERATGRSLAVKAQKKQGAPTAVDLEALLVETSGKREKWLQDRTDRKLTDMVKKAVAEAATIEDLHAALLPVIDLAATPDLVPKGAMVLQPSEERRRSGSHYTPRSLTEPIVRKTLEPVLAKLRETAGGIPKPDQILDLKVCDPAMGSGAFLVEICRHLGDALIEAWTAHGSKPAIPPDEDEVIFARRLVAQRCLYGVDRNPIAVDLAKVSLWLVTLARDHSLTFVDHALRHGDSLVGLSQRQIETFHWDSSAPRFQAGFEAMHIREHLEKVGGLRRRIRHAGESVTALEMREMWHEAETELRKVRLFGDLVLAAFFQEEKPKDRESKRLGYAREVAGGEAERHGERLEEWRHAEQPLVPFHWDLEFPEVFDGELPGFHCIVSNPPFMGGARIWPALGSGYANWIRFAHPKSDGRAVDLVAHFLRRAFTLLNREGCFGLIATNSVAQGDTREAGLKQICRSGGHIYSAIRRLRWPGSAAVVVSVVFVLKGSQTGKVTLDGHTVAGINSYLFPSQIEFDPAPLGINANCSFQGACVLGMGFTFDDSENSGVASSLAEMKDLIQRDPRNSERIVPYIGGKEINSDPRHAHHRYVIDFSNMSLEQASEWPLLLDLVKARVKPARDKMGGYSVADRRREFWWQFGTTIPALNKAKANLERILVIARISNAFAPVFLPAKMVFNEKTIVFPFGTYSSFAMMQSRVHEIWARFFGSTLKDDFQYTPADCFETYPFPHSWTQHPILDMKGSNYYEFRASLMVRNNEGLTKTYNRFHDPEERDPDILKLREMHAAMDRAVLDAYGWNDIPTDCEFLLDYEIDEEEWGDKKKPYRYRWPDEVRDEVLGRLLELNAKRAKEEELAGAASKGLIKSKSTRQAKRSQSESLFS